MYLSIYFLLDRRSEMGRETKIQWISLFTREACWRRGGQGWATPKENYWEQGSSFSHETQVWNVISIIIKLSMFNCYQCYVDLRHWLFIKNKNLCLCSYRFILKWSYSYLISIIYRTELENYLQSTFHFLEKNLPPVLAEFLHFDKVSI